MVPFLAKYCVILSFISLIHLITCLTDREYDISVKKAFEYMKTFQYMSNTNVSMGNMKPDEILSMEVVHNAILDFQCTWGLKETGILDKDTSRLLNLPRCGMPDNNMRCVIKSKARRKRYVVYENQWEVKKLTYKINSYTTDLPNRDIRSELSKAFKLWTGASQLEISEISSGNVDMNVEFYTRDHDDGSPFDGQGKVLAHAFSPGPDIGGDIHFDDDEYFTKDSYEGVNFQWVAAHEAGHALGLGHSNSFDALMAPFYQGWKPDRTLSMDDIAGIQLLYGASKEMETTFDTEDEICKDSKIDAITRTDDGSVYAFRKDHYYKITKSGFEKGLIKEKFSKVPNNIHTAVYNPKDGMTLFIKGTNYIAYHDTTYRGKGNLTKIFKNIPSKLDSMFYNPKNGYLFATVGNQYYRIIRNSIGSGFPKPLSERWLKSKRIEQKDLPKKIDAAFVHPNGRLYLFSGNKYYTFNTRSQQIRSAHYIDTDWFNCMVDHRNDPDKDMMNIYVHDQPNNKEMDTDFNFLDFIKNIFEIGNGSSSIQKKTAVHFYILFVYFILMKL